MNKPKFDPASLGLVNTKAVGDGVFRCVNSIQFLTPQQQITACAVLLQLQCRKFNTHIGTVLDVANNVIDRTIHDTPQLAAAKEFVRQEMK